MHTFADKCAYKNKLNLAANIFPQPPHSAPTRMSSDTLLSLKNKEGGSVCNYDCRAGEKHCKVIQVAPHRFLGLGNAAEIALLFLEEV